MLRDIAKKMADGADIALALDESGTHLTLQSGRSKFRLQTLPPEDFPEFNPAPMDFTFTIGAKTLQAIIEQTSFAMSTEATRYYLNGIYLHCTEGGLLRAVSTDGHRLARFEMEAPEGAIGMPGIIVPRKTTSEILNLTKSGEGEVTVELSATKIRICMGDTTLTSKLIDGTFPDYERVVPRTNDKNASFDRAKLAEAVERVSVVASEKSRAVRIDLTKDSLKLSVTSADAGNAEDEIDVSYEDDPLTIGFNSAYLSTALSVLSGEEVKLSLNDGGSPALFTAADMPGLLVVLMPMRV
jgi:DNA polymerase-3 subunit beta